MDDVQVELVFHKPPPEITDFELVKTFWISPTFSDSDANPELKVENTAPSPPKTSPLGRLLLRASGSGSESGATSCSEELQLPEEILNEPLVDDVFEEEPDDVCVQTDLLFRQPKASEVELVYTLALPEEQKFDDPVTDVFEQKEDVSVDLLFREPTDTAFELIYTIPLMEDVTIITPEDVLEKVPAPEELDNVVEEADVTVTEFTFTPMKQPSGDDETLTTEVVTVLEAPNQHEEPKLSSEDTFDDVEDAKEEEAFQNTFVKSFETPSPGEEASGDVAEYCDEDVVKQTLEDAAEKLRKNSNDPDVVDSSSPKDVKTFEFDESPELPVEPSEDVAEQVASSEDVEHLEATADDVESKPGEVEQETKPSKGEVSSEATEDVEAEKTYEQTIEEDGAVKKFVEMTGDVLPVDDSSIEEKQDAVKETNEEVEKTPDDVIERSDDVDETVPSVEDKEYVVEKDDDVTSPNADVVTVPDGLQDSASGEEEKFAFMDEKPLPVDDPSLEEVRKEVEEVPEESLPEDVTPETPTKTEDVVADGASEDVQPEVVEEDPEESAKKLAALADESLPVDEQTSKTSEGEEGIPVETCAENVAAAREDVPKEEEDVPEKPPQDKEKREDIPAVVEEGNPEETAEKLSVLADEALPVDETSLKTSGEEEVAESEPVDKRGSEKTSEENKAGENLTEEPTEDVFEAVLEDVIQIEESEKKVPDVPPEDVLERVPEDVGQLEDVSPFTIAPHEFRRSKRPSPEELPKDEGVTPTEDVEENVAEATVSVEIIGIDPTEEVSEISEIFEEIKQDVVDGIPEDALEDVTQKEEVQELSAPEDTEVEDVVEVPVLENSVPEDVKEHPTLDIPEIIETAAPEDVEHEEANQASASADVEHSEDVADDAATETVVVSEETPEDVISGDVHHVASEDTITKTTTAPQESDVKSGHDVHFQIPKDHPDFGNDYVPFGTEPSEYKKTVEFKNPEEEDEEEDVVAELHFQPIRQWKDEDVISLQSLKSLVAEVGCTTETEESKKTDEGNEETLKILKVVPSEPSLMELDISNDPSIIHVPIPLLESSTRYLEDMVDWIVAEAVKEVGEREVVTESELSEMVPEVVEETKTPEPLEDLKLPFEDDEKTPEPEPRPEIPVEAAPQRPPRAPKQQESPPKAPKVRFGPLSIKLGRSYSEEQKTLEEMLEKPLEVVTSPSLRKPEDVDDDGGLSPLSPRTLAEYEHIPVMDIRSVPHSPQEKGHEEEEDVREDVKEEVVETAILGAGKSAEDVGRLQDPEDEDGSECLDSIGDLSERTIQRFNTSIDDPSIRRDSFSSISSFGDRQKFRTAIENIRQDLLPFQSSVSQYLEPSPNPSQQLLVANLSMDSPSDLSPNAPPVGFENTAQFLEKLQANETRAGEDRPSAEGSIDSSGFEKVDHEGLDDFVPPVVDPMQQSVFGSLQAEEDGDVARTPPTSPVTPFAEKKNRKEDDGFVFIEPNDYKMSSSHHDDVIEKNYFGGAAGDDVAKILESPIAEEARKLVQDAVESASEATKPKVDEADDIARELLDNVQHAAEPVTDSLHKAYDGLGDFVHETVPKAVDDFVHHEEKPESPKPKTPSPEPPVNIHDTVNQVHDEIDSFLHRRDPTPPLEEADEDAGLPDVDDNKPHFGNQTPEEDETTFDRKGPLTIPEEVEKAAAAQKVDDFAEFDPLYSANTGAQFGAAVGEALTEEEIFGHQKFETVPRPPTPPKDISDEDVKPSTVNLGPAHHHSHPSSPHHSILKHHGEPWIDFKTVPPCVLDVIYWRDPKKSAVVLSLALLALFILAKYPLLTVITYSLLLSLGAAAGFRVFKKVESQIKKTDAEHPFSEILAKDLSLPQEKVHAQADVFVEHATSFANTLKKLVFVESPLESVKFGLVLWSLTYIASWFSGFTLAILGLLGVFSVPKVYESNQEAIDPHLATISGHLKNVQNLIDEKLPFLRSAPVAAEEKKDQ